MKKLIMRLRQRMNGLIYKNKFADMLVHNYDFRTLIFSSVSLIVDIGFIIFNVVVFGLTGSLWCGAVIIYHGILVLLRGNLLRNHYCVYKLRIDHQEKMLREIKRYRLCGICFMILDLCLITFVLMIVRGEKVFSYNSFEIYVYTGYTLYRIVLSVINYVRVRKNDNYTVRSLRCINLTSAIISYVSMQAISLDMFSENINVSLMNAFTGLVAASLILALGTYMIIHSAVKIKNMENITHHS